MNKSEKVSVTVYQEDAQGFASVRLLRGQIARHAQWTLSTGGRDDLSYWR
jgi:hypothetical protein